MNYPKDVDEIINEKEVPAIWANKKGIVEGINDAFTKEYGWEKSDLIGKSLTTIIPPEDIESHSSGFARFPIGHEYRISGRAVTLSILLKNKSVKKSTHFILGDKKDGEWRFAAIITPGD